MSDKWVIPEKTVLLVSVGYVFASLLIIVPLYYLFPSSQLEKLQEIYHSLDVDLPSISIIMIAVYRYSVILNIVVAIFSSWFYFRNKRIATNIPLLVLLNLSLFACIGWYHLVSFALNLPVQQLFIFIHSK